jgi:hypothetical protein
MVMIHRYLGVHHSWGGSGRISLAADESTSKGGHRVYALVSSAKDFSLEGFYRSVNDGGTWTKFNKPLKSYTGVDLAHITYDKDSNPIKTPIDPLGTQGFYNLALALDQNNPLAVYIGGQNRWFGAPYAGQAVLQSLNGGDNWAAIDGFFQGKPPAAGGILPHPDHHALLVGKDGVVFDGNDGGIFKFTPLAGKKPGIPEKGSAWTNLNIGLQTNLVNSVATNNQTGATFFIVEGT